MHAASILHADMKSDNVLLNTADVWHLADFGACVEVGQPIQSCNEAWYPGTMMGQQADAKYDWGLLVVLTAVE
ncbi:TPA: Protein kinase, membrane associated tyrosine threonine 1 [Trebouxia sp. C0006]